MLLTVYRTLPAEFYRAVHPTPVRAPQLLRWNTALAQALRLPDDWSDVDRADYFAGNRLLPESQPLATAYAGHQFGGFVPQLGDGRAILLGERVLPRMHAGAAPGATTAAEEEVRVDIQLKGAGPTPYSRGGDGRAAIGPVLREYLVSEWMHTLGVPTTRALAAVATGETVYRDRPLPGAVLTRIASSHVRVGTFQFAAHRDNLESLRALADFTIARHYPALQSVPSPDRYRALLRAVMQAQATLVAQWMALGFVHGVMNTDNCSVAGLTIDYGPCAFMDGYQPEQTFSSIDHNKRYAYDNQPGIALWNLARFAECLIPLFGPSETNAVAWAEATLMQFRSWYERARLAAFARKLGFVPARPDASAAANAVVTANLDDDYANRVAEARAAHASQAEPTAGASTADRNPASALPNLVPSDANLAERDDAALIEALLRIAREAQLDFTLLFWMLGAAPHQRASLLDALAAASGVATSAPAGAATASEAASSGTAAFVAPQAEPHTIVDALTSLATRTNPFAQPAAPNAVNRMAAQPGLSDATRAQLLAWLQTWQTRCANSPDRAAMQAANPLFIPRNHALDRVVRAAADGDLAPFERLASTLAAPTDWPTAPPHEWIDLARPALRNEWEGRTFCGT